MFLAIIKNDFLLMLRDRKAMLITLLMPFVLITILGFSLSSVMNVEDIPINAHVGIVSEQNVEEEIERFSKLVQTLEIPPELKTTLIEVGNQLEPEKYLVHQVLASNELKPYVNVQYYELEEAKKLLENNELTSVMVFQKNFSSQTLENLLIERHESAELTYIVNEQQEMNASFVQSIIDSQFNQMTYESAVSKLTYMVNGMEATMSNNTELSFSGDMRPVEGAGVISSFMYYALGMGVMFALFTTSYAAIYAYKEKETHIYERLVLANVPSYQYLVSKWISTTMFSFIQFTLLISLSGIFYQVPWTNLFGMFVITLCFSFAIGAITPLLTALNYRFKSTNATSIFMSGGVSLLALLGGSFLPMSQLPESIESIGNYTLNGAALRAHILLQQGFSLSESLEYIVIMIASICFFIIAAFLLFPKEGAKI